MAPFIFSTLRYWTFSIFGENIGILKKRRRTGICNPIIQKIKMHRSDTQEIAAYQNS